MNNEQLQAARARVEQEYDALITELTRCQQQLSAKAQKAAVMSPEEYRRWLADKKKEQSDIQNKIAKKKAERAEARRKANHWQPPPEPEQWLDRPDDEGWWWFYRPGRDLEILEFYYDSDNELVCDRGRIADDSSAKWRYQEEPERP